MITAMQDPAARKDAEGLRRAAHSIKGAVAAFSAQPALDAALKLERLARTREWNGVEDLCARLEAEIGRLREALAEVVTQRMAPVDDAMAKAGR